MSLDPPLPVYLFNIVSGLRDKSAKGYPVKKVGSHYFLQVRYSSPQLLLLLWKTLLSCFGGVRDYARVQNLSRELAGLSETREPEEGAMALSLPTMY